MGRSRGRLTAGWFRSPAPGRTAQGARRGRDGRVRRASPEHRAATPRGAGPRHARGSRAAAPRPGAAAGPREAAGPPGTGSLDGRRGSRGAGSLDGRPGSRGAGSLDGQRGSRGAGSLDGRPGSRWAGRRRAAGTPRLASSAPGMTWAAGAADQSGPAVPNRRPPPGPGALRPGIRAAVARSLRAPPRAAPRSACRQLRRPPSAAGTPPLEHLGTPGLAWSPGQRRSRGIGPRSLACARRGERRSGHPANTRSSVSASVPAPGPAPGTPPPGAGDRRGGGATSRPG